MNRSTTSVASSHTQVDLHERSLRYDDGKQDLEKHADRDNGTSSSPTPPSSPDRDTKPSPVGPPGPPPNELYQPKTLKFWLILVANFLAMFLVALDRTIVATAIPRITDDFHSLGDIGWCKYLHGPIMGLRTALRETLLDLVALGSVARC